MGFHSFITQDTDKSISNKYSDKGALPVYMTDNKGNQWHEDDYEGYGSFGDKDFYELLAEMNGMSTRDEGLNLYFSDTPHLQPNLTERKNWEWQDLAIENCPNQGYFYDDEWGPDDPVLVVSSEGKAYKGK